VSFAYDGDDAENREIATHGSDYELAQGLSIRARRRLSGFAAGEQRSPATGGGIEFADYREYVPGDDVRLLDWTVYLRSRKLLVKLCAEEKELTLVAIVDISRSMDYGTPTKLELAKRIASVLACVALRGGNRAGVAALGASLLEPIRPERKKLTMAGIARAVHALEPVAASSPEAALRQFAASYGGKCVAVLLSDLLFPRWQKSLDALASSGCEAHVVQILAPEEFAPPERGEVTFVDMEDGSETATHLDDALLGRYGEALEAFLARTGAECARRGLGRCLLRSDSSLERVFYEDFKRAGIVC
jgi:uncharacterized protein (DUF58 family)